MKIRLLLFVLLGLGTAGAAEKPNLLFIFADDMTWKAVNALSDEDIDTPNLDRLAAHGTSFSHAYNSGAWGGAVCVASRTMLNTGYQLWTAKSAEKGLKDDVAGKNQAWSQLLSAAGYRTCISGKWHVKMNASEIFDESRNVRPGMPKTVKKAYKRPIEGKPDPWNPADTSLGGFWSGGKHWSEVVADDFEFFLAQNSDKPWFMYMAFNAPHDPRQAPQEYLDKYPLERVQVPKNFLPVYPHCGPMGAAQGLRDESLAPSPRTEFAVKTHRKEYYALVTHLDAQIGRMLDALEKSPCAKNTVICFTADHGLGVGEHGLMGKQNMYDHSVRVPFLLSGPGMPEGRTIDAPIYLQDVMPTFLELAGAEVPEHVAFESVLPHLTGKGKAREQVFGAYIETQRMLTRGNQKLILYPRAEVVRVFDLEKDPDEMNDLYETPEGKAIAKQLFAHLTEELKRQGDTLDLKAVYPDL